MIHEDAKTIGRYKVVEALGSGAMGAVYLCLDPLLKRKVAVKIVLNSHSDSETMLARFQRESEISAQLNHPNIISVYDVGNDELLGPFITMEYVEGSSLAKLLQTESPVNPKVAMDWICQMGQALVAAESAGVVHRDIKPENILIGKNGRLKLTDFGLARLEDSSLTTTGVVMGTPSYTAPELLGGVPASPATDRWAFTVAVFQIITGNRLPHRADSLPALMHHIVNEQPILPEEMPAPLKRVFLKALHRDPTRRYDSTLRFLEALADALGMRDQLDIRGLGLMPPESGPLSDATATQNIPKASPGKQAGEVRAVSSSPVPGSGSGSGSGEQAAGPPAARISKLTAPPSDLFHGEQETQDLPSDVLVGAIRTQASHAPSAMRTGSPKQAVSRSSATDSGFKGAYVLAALLLLLVAGYFGIPRSIRIESVPPGAKITVDDRVLGITPLDGRLFYGTHVINAQLEGYEMEVRSIDAREGDQVFDLKPTMAWTDILTEPPGAEVLLGSRHLGKTPLQGIMIPLRSEKIVITLPGYHNWEGLLGPANRLPSSITLQPNP